LRRGFSPADNHSNPAGVPMPNPAGSLVVNSMLPASSAAGPGQPKAEETVEEGLHIITSPIVGTFYRAPTPGAEPYAKIGMKLEVGTILCIVEAMKLMNEIPSDVAGEVVEIFAENGHPVEFGQKLFGIRTRK
jgi:acetyl-CoA carboxylase biotin carboxyl carrier protein